MKVKFNKFERVAGLFVMSAIVGSLVVLVGVAVKRGWFEPKVDLETTFASAEGIHAGTTVQMSGLRAGSVESVDLKSNNEIRVQIRISKKFFERVHQDSVVRVMRPFVIGEKVLDISVGSEESPQVTELAMLKSEESGDLMDLISGRKLGQYLSMMDKLGENLKVVAEAFLDPQRSKDLVQILDEVRPLVVNASSLTKEANTLLKSANKGQRLAKTLDNLSVLSEEMARVLPQFTKDSPDLAKDLTKIAHNTASLTEELAKLTPLMNQMAPELPRVSKRTIELLDETVVTLKAMQKSWLLSGKVKDVREEESKRDQERAPAAAEAPPSK
jgi:phospholipid/cholesterol/gamma-HCH transport system substrate-binding protein